MRCAKRAFARAARLRARLPELSDPPASLLAALAASGAETNLGADEVQALAERALALGAGQLVSLNGVLVGLIKAECYDVAERVCEEALVLARGRGAVHELTNLASLRAWSRLCAGALADAEGDARWALEQPTTVPSWHAVATLVEVLVERDELEEAEAQLEQMPFPRGSHANFVYRGLAARGALRAAQGRLEHALADLTACGELCERFGVCGPQPPWRSVAAVIHATLGDNDRALRLAGEGVELARAFGRPRALGIALRAQGVVSEATEGLGVLREAVTVLEGARAPVELARARTAYGIALRRCGLQRGSRLA